MMLLFAVWQFGKIRASFKFVQKIYIYIEEKTGGKVKSLTGSVKVGTPAIHPDLWGRAVPDEVLQKHIDKNYTLSANLQLRF